VSHHTNKTNDILRGEGSATVKFVTFNGCILDLNEILPDWKVIFLEIAGGNKHVLNRCQVEET